MPRNEAEKRITIRPDENAQEEARRLAGGLSTLSSASRELYLQLTQGMGQSDRLMHLGSGELGESSIESLADQLTHFRQALKGLTSMTDIAGLPIDEMQKQVDSLAAVLRKAELVRNSKTLNEAMPTGLPKSLGDLRERGNIWREQERVRREIVVLDNTIRTSEYQSGEALQKILGLEGMEVIWNLVVMYADAMRITREEIVQMIGDLAELEMAINKNAKTARSLAEKFSRVEARRVHMADLVAEKQKDLAGFDTRADDTRLRRDRMDKAAKDIDSMAAVAAEYNKLFMESVQQVLQMKGVTVSAGAKREMMDTYLSGIKYLMTMYYMLGAGLTGGLTGVARIVGAGMREYLECETQRVLGTVGENLRLLDAVVEEVEGEIKELMIMGTMIEKPDDPKLPPGA